MPIDVGELFSLINYTSGRTVRGVLVLSGYGSAVAPSFTLVIDFVYKNELNKLSH